MRGRRNTLYFLLEIRVSLDGTGRHLVDRDSLPTLVPQDNTGKMNGGLCMLSGRASREFAPSTTRGP